MFKFLIIILFVSSAPTFLSSHRTNQDLTGEEVTKHNADGGLTEVDSEETEEVANDSESDGAANPELIEDPYDAITMDDTNANENASLEEDMVDNTPETNNLIDEVDETVEENIKDVEEIDEHEEEIVEEDLVANDNDIQQNESEWFEECMFVCLSCLFWCEVFSNCHKLNSKLTPSFRW